MKQIVLLTTVLALAATQQAAAQYIENSYHASTAGESWARGWGDMVQSYGNAALSLSQAATQNEVTNAAYIKNRDDAQKTYYEMRRRYVSFRKEMEGPQPGFSQLAAAAKAEAPKRLTSSQLDPLTGEIAWPVALRQDAFAADRAKIQELFGKTSHGSQVSYDTFMALEAATKGLYEKLKAQVNELPGQLYAEAAAFMRSLIQESKHIAG